MKEEILQKIKDVITEYSDVDASQIGFDSALMDINLTSIEIMSVVAEIQRAYDITIATDEMMGIQTVQDLVDLIEKKIA